MTFCSTCTSTWTPSNEPYHSQIYATTFSRQPTSNLNHQPSSNRPEQHFTTSTTKIISPRTPPPKTRPDSAPLLSVDIAREPHPHTSNLTKRRSSSHPDTKEEKHLSPPSPHPLPRRGGYRHRPPTSTPYQQPLLPIWEFSFLQTNHCRRAYWSGPEPRSTRRGRALAILWRGTNGQRDRPRDGAAPRMLTHWRTAASGHL